MNGADAPHYTFHRMPSRLVLSDRRLFPAQAFFNAVGDSSFVQMIDHLTRGIGCSAEAAQCSFPSDLDPGDETFVGVQFAIFEDSVIVTGAQFQGLLKEAADAYSAAHPSDRPILDEYLKREIPT